MKKATPGFFEGGTGGAPLECSEESAVTKFKIENESVYQAPCSALTELHRQYFVCKIVNVNSEQSEKIVNNSL